MDDEALRANVATLLRSARAEAGLTQRALARAAATSQAAVARYESGVVLPDLRTLRRLVSACGRDLAVDAPRRVRPGRSGRESAAVRPVAVPRRLDSRSIEKADGLVELPRHIRWSGPRRSYDLGKRRDRIRVYEQVLREGTEADVQHYVRGDELVALWDELTLPASVRAAWQPRVEQLRRRRRC